MLQWSWTRPFLVLTVVFLVWCSPDAVVVMVDATAVHVPLGAETNPRRPRVGSCLDPPTSSVASLSYSGGEPWLSTARGGAAAAASNNFAQKIRRFTEHSGDEMPCLFSKKDEIYDRYAACLAATEGLRRIRDRDITEQQDRIMASRKTTADGTPVPESLKLQAVAQAKRRITAKYVQQSIKVLRALGMSVNEFNGMGGDIAKDAKLKEKVMEQAYLYRMAATVNMDRAHIDDGSSSPQSSSSSSALASKSKSSASKSKSSSSSKEGGFKRDKVALFCSSMSEIEKLRAGQLQRLKQALHVKDFPEHVNISDPSLLPFLNPKVRAVVEAFPLQAEAIIKRKGLASDEFNQMLEATKSNPFFRWKIQKVMRDTISNASPMNRSNQPRPAGGPPPKPQNPRAPVGQATAL